MAPTIKQEIDSIFEECQSGNHTQLLRRLNTIYHKLRKTGTESEFWNLFCRTLQHFLIVNNNDLSVDRGLHFISLFVQPVDDNTLLTKTFNFLIPLHKASSNYVRIHTCQLTAHLFANMKDDFPLDDNLYEQVVEMLLALLKDKSSVVRVNACRALSRLQNPSDKDCPIIKEYLFHMECDPSADVRSTVINSIGTSKNILAAVLERTRDAKDSVRKSAIGFLSAKIHFRCLSIAQRVQLLKDGVQDRSELVKKAVLSKLIPAWIKLAGGTMLNFLSYLDIENYEEAVELILSSYVKVKLSVSIEDLIQALEKENLIKISNETQAVTSELAFYWRVLANQDLNDASLEKILPELHPFCKYVKKIIESSLSNETVENSTQPNSFVVQQLILLAKEFDIIDEATRQIVVKFSQELLTSNAVSQDCVDPLVDLLVSVTGPDESKSILLIAEIISEIQQPITNTESQLNVTTKENNSEMNSISWKRCLTIACNLLKQPFITTLHPSIQSIMDNLLLPGIQNSDPMVRNFAVKGLGLVCLLSKQLAQHNALLFLQILQIDQESIRITAAKVLFDLLITFGIEAFEPENSDNFTDESKMKIVSVLTLLLDNEESEVRSVVMEGLGKLLLSEIISSTKLLSRLILLWFNPISEDHSSVSHFLGVFLPVFASASRRHQQSIEEAFLPTLHTILEAPESSPLKDININNVAKFMVALLHPRMTRRNTMQKTGQDDENLTSIHYNLALRVCNALLNESRNKYVRVYANALSWLDLSECDAVSIRQLTNLHAEIAELKLEKTSAKILIKFKEKLVLDTRQMPTE